MNRRGFFGMLLGIAFSGLSALRLRRQREARNARIAAEVLADYEKYGELRLPADLEDSLNYLWNNFRLVGPVYFLSPQGVLKGDSR